MTPSGNVRFWWHWLLANAFAEVVGLGLVGALATLLLAVLGERRTAAFVLAFALFTIALGAFEGLVVGWAQTRVLRQRLSGVEGWIRATIVGALVAWLAGMIPSTIMNLLPHDPAAVPPDIPESARLLLAAGLGLVAGPLLAVFQYRVLRRYVGRAGWWLLANALAWAAGMPVVFAGIHLAYSAGEPWKAAGVLIGTLAFAGAMAGAVHGLFLVHLVRPGNRLPVPAA